MKTNADLTTHHEQIKRIVQRLGGYREKEIFKQPHELSRGTWNNDHKVIYITTTHAEQDGHKAAFAVDIVTNKICG